jgi:ectoine hydroxylase-related dioxygenase (phytanoyl-CoA dioxygenase family)
MTHAVVTTGLDENAVAAFVRDGFVVVPQLVRPTELKRIRAILLRLHETNAGFKEGAQFDAVAPDGDMQARRFPQILSPHIYAPELCATEYFQNALQIAREILGPNARLKLDISFMKPPRIGSDTPWHQDDAFGNPAFDQKDITIWLAVTQATPSNSCMSFIPGSHLYPVLMHQPLGGDPRVHALECIGDFDSSLAVECPLQAGDCTIHSCRTLHYAGPNPSEDYRLAYALLFDTPPTLRAVPHDFPWSKQQHTDRAARHQRWRRHGGIIIDVWRKRYQLGPRAAMELRRMLKHLKKWW